MECFHFHLNNVVSHQKLLRNFQLIFEDLFHDLLKELHKYQTSLLLSSKLAVI